MSGDLFRINGIMQKDTHQRYKIEDRNRTAAATSFRYHYLSHHRKQRGGFSTKEGLFIVFEACGKLGVQVCERYNCIANARTNVV